MTNKARTIRIFLPDGDPTGIRVAEVTTSVLQVYDIPRSKLNDHFSQNKEKQAGIYFLFGEDEDTDEKLVYIGQTQNLKLRLNQHNEKEFWNRVVIAVSTTNIITHTHAIYLEWRAIEKTKSAERFKLENGNNGSKPDVQPHLEADCELLFELIELLVSTLGYHLFKPLLTVQQSKEDIFYCKRNGVNAQGILTDEGFIVLKGSVGKKDISTKRISERRQRSIQSQRDKAKNANAIVVEDDKLVFVKDYLFNSPSGASSAVLGHPSNGWMDWKDSLGKTLDKIKRIK
jgi:predicted GIY-YIG superfamily endonuclease